jgi:5-formyltetrahydrofolate cyclo-ligase
MQKQEIRAAMKLFLAGITAQERHTRSLAACQNLASTKEFKRAQTIMIFMSMGTEIETCTLAIKAWQECKNIAVPRVDWEHHRMEPIEIKSLEVGMITKGGIKEPADGITLPLGMIDMVVIPGMAFDRHGYRVGRGKGFYDRFLAQQDFQGIRCALCYHEQLHEYPVPCEPHDIAMNLIVTDQEIIHCPSHAHAVNK